MVAERLSGLRAEETFVLTSGQIFTVRLSGTLAVHLDLI